MVLQGQAHATAPHERMTVTEQQAPSVRETAYIGGLDGLRAIAVAAVMLYHFSPKALPAGFLGVDVFFVVSGFLIARLLVTEVARSGQVSFANFWGRRARRLLPALATMTVVVCIVAWWDFSRLELHDIRAHALSTLFYCANWVMRSGQSYFATVGRPSPFLHMWSLAVEEQFYVVLPIVFFFIRGALVRQPVRVAVIALLGALGSSLLMAAAVSPGADPSRAYLGSHTHAMGLLVGVALGVLAGAGEPWNTFKARLQDRTAAVRTSFVLGLAALVGVLLTMRLASDHTYGLYRGGGFLWFSLACGVLIASVALTPATPLAKVLRTPWLVAIGLRSYSLYLWHWPVRVFISPERIHNGTALFLVRTVVSVVLAELSFRLVERPFRTGAIARRWGSRGAIASFAVLVILTALLVYTVDQPKGFQ